MTRRLLLLTWLTFGGGLLLAQEFTNPSFEGPIRLHFPPPHWNGCHPNSTPDTGPGSWGQALVPSDGESFVVLVIRDYESPEQNVEEVSQVIDPPLQAGQTYHFAVDLGYLTDLAHLPGQTSLAAPCRLQVWGSGGLCQPSRLLWTSPVIDHASWARYTVAFTADTLIRVLRFVSSHRQAGTPSRGNVCLDHLSPIYLGAPPQLDLGPDTTLCAGDSLWVSVPGQAVRWSDGDTRSERWLTQAGTYQVEVDYPVRYAQPGPGGDPVWVEATVPLTASLHLTLQPRPTVDLGRDTLLCLGESLWLDGATSLPGGTYRWADGLSGPQREIREPGHYRLEVAQGGCEGGDSLVVAYRDCRAWLTFPNVFTPNGDGINERFEPSFAANVASVSLTLYDRWGREVYAASRLYPGWDGQLRERPAPVGVYFWAIRWTDPLGEVHQDRGSLTLLR